MSSNGPDNFRAWAERWIGARSLEPARARRERAVYLITLGVSAVGAFACVWMFLLWLRHPEAVKPTAAGVGIVIFLEGMTAYGVARTGRVTVAAWMTVLATTAIAAFVVAGQGINSVSAIILAPAVTLAGMLIGSRAAGVVVGVEVLVTIAIGLAQSVGWQPPQMQPSVPMSVLLVVASLVFLLFINGLSWRLIRQSLALAEAQTERLRVAHQEQQRLVADLRTRDERQVQLLATLRELSTPVIPVVQGIIILPLVGHMDAERLVHVRATLLAGIARRRARIVLLEMTGVSELDRAAAEGLPGLADAARLLGAELVVVGVQAGAARVMVELAVDTSGLAAQPDLESALAYASARQQQATLGRSPLLHSVAVEVSDGNGRKG